MIHIAKNETRATATMSVETDVTRSVVDSSTPNHSSIIPPSSSALIIIMRQSPPAKKVNSNSIKPNLLPHR
jgi:hypothetical protein